MKSKQIILVLGMVFLSFILQSCASDEELQARFLQGKQNFLEQNYPQAYHDLLPVAKAGNADAEYAIGYMYFYGKGILEDNTLAEYWMEKAAAQGHKQAQQALELIKERNHEIDGPGPI